MISLGELLELVFTANDRPLTLTGEAVSRRFKPAVIGQAEKNNVATAHRINARSDPTESRVEIVTAPGGRWRIRDVDTNALTVCDGRRVWRQRGSTVVIELPTRTSNPHGRLLDPSFLLVNRRISIEGPVLGAGRSGCAITASARQTANDVSEMAETEWSERAVVDLEFGVLLHYEKLGRGRQRLAEEEFVHLSTTSVDDETFLYRPPPSAKVLDHTRQSSWQDAPPAGVRLALAVFSFRQAWRALRGELHSAPGKPLPQYFPIRDRGRGLDGT